MTLIRLTIDDINTLLKGGVIERVGGPSIRITFEKWKKVDMEDCRDLIRALADR